MSNKLDRQAAREQIEEIEANGSNRRDVVSLIEISRSVLTELAAQDALIASQAAEIAELKRIDLIRRQAFVADAKQWAVESDRQSALIQSLREALENAPHGVDCPQYCARGWKFATRKRDREACNCWKSRALAQVSASQVQTEEKTNE